ncbi:hypothetical protein P8452_44496 [Trifolium repens]|nr:hypothetical protein P8452_44496 [Trifolium repens]
MADEITPVEEIQNKSTEEEQQHRLSANVEPTHDSSTSDIDHLVVMVHGMEGRYKITKEQKRWALYLSPSA